LQDREAAAGLIFTAMFSPNIYLRAERLFLELGAFGFPVLEFF
jgi:hypothetical protein